MRLVGCPLGELVWGLVSSLGVEKNLYKTPFPEIWGSFRLEACVRITILPFEP